LGFLLVSNLSSFAASYFSRDNDPSLRAYSHFIKGEYSKAEPLLKESLAEKEKKFGKDHTNVALCLENLALLYRVEGKYREAEQLFKNALFIRKRALGENDPSLLISLENLALIYEIEERYDEAEALSRH